MRSVTIVGASLARPLGTEMGAVCAALHAEHGVRLITGAGTAELAGDTRVRAVRLADGRELPADLVVAGIGAVPCVGLAGGFRPSGQRRGAHR
jgi:3-phenylpropionate/trans-cinnamate dioxygenase ferredoxin reductase subunit